MTPVADLRETPHLLPEWHAEPWVRLLEAAYETNGPKAVADRIGYSAGLVTAIVRGYYDANPAKVADAVMATLGQAEVDCPVLGTLPLTSCRRHRTAPFSAASPLSVRLWKACRTCPNNPDSQTR